MPNESVFQQNQPGFFFFFRLLHVTLCYIAFVLSSLCSVDFKSFFFFLALALFSLSPSLPFI